LKNIRTTDKFDITNLVTLLRINYNYALEFTCRLFSST